MKSRVPMTAILLLSLLGLFCSQEKEEEDIRFSWRCYPAAVEFQGKLWVVGGKGFDPLDDCGKEECLEARWRYLNDVWSSEDGVTWERVVHHAPFDRRWKHTLTVHNGRMFLMGGSCHNDVWVTDDGANWSCLTDNAPWAGRDLHTVISYNGKLWLIGGMTGPYTFYEDVWSSPDGATWTLVTSQGGFRFSDSTASYRGLAAHGSCVFDGKMWIVSGMSPTWVSSSHCTYSYTLDVWSSTDGVTWILETATANYLERTRFSLLVHDGKMWIIAGKHDRFMNDVWSNDGTDWANWTEVNHSAPFEPRNSHASAVFQGRMWILGGSTDTPTDYIRNGVYASADGVNWEAVLPDTPWGCRAIPE